MHWIMHWILQSLENTGAAALDLAPVLRAADLTAAAQLLQHPSPCVTTALLPTAVLLGGACPHYWPPPHHIASIASGRHTAAATTLPDQNCGKVPLAAVCQLLNTTLLSTSPVFV